MTLQSLGRMVALTLLVSALGACASGGRANPTASVAAVPPEPEAASLHAPAEPHHAATEVPAEVPLEAVETAPDAEPEPEAAASAARAPGHQLLSQSLGAYEAAQEAWKRGDFESAIELVDSAYGQMAEAEVDGDPSLAQQKEDLRRLIAQLVVEVYASTRTAAGDLSEAIPRTVNDQVKREIGSFQTAERAEFLAGYRRSGLYRPMIVEVLRDQGLPEQLSWMPMVESWFKVRALSRARALGMWQFIASTGYRFGLARTEWRDERMDPEKSTRAAAAYLTELHEMFGDWMTALSAYNSGEARVLRLIKQQRVAYFDQFWDLYEGLPQETRRYVPRFLATLAIVENPERYGFADLPDPLPPADVRTVEVERSVRLGDLEKQLELDRGTLAALNPELRRGVTPPAPYTLRVPAAEKTGAVLASVEALPEAPAPVATTYRVRRGDTLSGIAARYHTSVRSLMRLNGLSNARRLRAGQTLRIAGSVSGGPSGKPFTYTVRRGDSLWRIASRYGTTVDRLKRDNGLRGSRLRPGQRLRVTPGGGGSSTYVVRPGDTLGRIAQLQRVSVHRLAAANGLTLRSTIYPGQRLVIPGR